MSPWKPGLGVKGTEEKVPEGPASSVKTASFHITSLHCTKQRVCLVPVNRFDTGKWYCWVGICTFGLGEKKKSKSKDIDKGNSKNTVLSKAEWKALGKILCRKEAYSKYWWCRLSFSSFTFKYIWL